MDTFARGSRRALRVTWEENVEVVGAMVSEAYQVTVKG
jgi:hypothetical protein